VNSLTPALNLPAHINRPASCKPQTEKNSYSLLNSRVSYLINKYVDIFVKGENLTDKKYYINYAYPMPGIIVFGGFNLHF
jgi:outer membrane cobalamin receptor